MRLVPPRVFEFKSSAERRIFGFLEEVRWSPADVALHSLNIGRHEYKRWGEADFVLVTKRGILLLEVKGGRVACTNGIWEFTNRFGETNTKLESPSAQASSAFFSLEKNYLNPMFRKDLTKVPSGFGVVFADVPRLASEGTSGLPEHPDEITAYEVECRGPNSFRAFLDRAFDHWQSRKNHPCELAPEMITKIVNSLRPNFERVPSLDNQLRQAERDFYQFTEEQYERMDEIAENDRILISGGAGTGKTFIAAACARYEASTGASVLFVTRSSFLKSFLAAQEFPPSVTVVALEELPALLPSHGAWDCLIVDEGQDLCDPPSLDLLERSLDGGWERGRWRWFGDPNHQVSPSFPLDVDCHEYLRSIAFRCHLKQNVRNSGKVIDAIASFAGADVGKPRSNPNTGKVALEIGNTAEEIDATTAKTLKRWLAGDGAASRSDIVVLLDANRDPKLVASELGKRGFRAEALSERALGKAKRDCVLVARIEDFKGLERPLVCIAGLTGSADEIASKVYKGVSRANHELVLVASRDTVEIMAKRAAEIATAKGGS